MGSFVGIQLFKVLHCKLPTIGKQLLTLPYKGSGFDTADLRGGRRVCYHWATVAPIQPIKLKYLTLYL